MLMPDNIDKIFGQAVVASFIHRNRHPEQNALISAIGLAGVDGHVMAVLYDCSSDRALHIHPHQWLDVDQRRLMWRVSSCHDFYCTTDCSW